MKKTKRLLIIALVMVFLGSLLAGLIQTDFGNVTVRDVRIPTDDGAVLSALLYIPKGVSAENPAPAIATSEGYLNSREMQTNFSVEFARRGYVVLAIDMFGHGRSTTEVDDIMGMTRAVQFLTGLEYVDSENIGVEGHSKGGLSATMAAAALPEGTIKSVLAAGSGLAWPLMYGIEWGADTPINYGTIFGTYDEFGWLFWPESYTDHGNVSAYGNYSEIMMAAWGTDQAVEPFQWYGDKSSNTLRIMYQPKETHPFNHVSNKSAAYAVNFMNETLSGGNPKGLADTDQIWGWKEFGTAVAMVGMFLFIFAFGATLLEIGKNKKFMTEPAAGKATFSAKFWIMLVIGTAIPGLTYFTFMNLGSTLLPLSRVFPQQMSSQTAIWALFNGLIAFALLLVVYFIFGKKENMSVNDWGIKAKGKNVLRQVLLGLLTAFGAYLLLEMADFFFKVDFRLWVIGFMPLTLEKFQALCAYFIFFAIYAFLNSVVLNASYRFAKGCYKKTALFSVLGNITGMVVLVCICYGGLFITGSIPFSDTGWSLLSIVAMPFLITLSMAALINTYFFKKTGTVYMGSTITALFLTFATVGNTAFQFLF